MSYQDLPPYLGDWLEVQPARAPDGILDAVMADVERAGQRNRWKAAVLASPLLGPRAVRLYGSVAVLGLVAVLGFLVGARQPAVGPTPSATPSPSSTASPIAQPLNWVLGDAPQFFVDASLEVPGASIAWFPTYQGATMAEVWSRDRLSFLLLTRTVAPYPDPCVEQPVAVDVGPLVGDLVDGLAQLPAVRSPVEDTSVDGHAAKELTLEPQPEGGICPNGLAPAWKWSDGYRPANVHPETYAERYYPGTVDPTSVWVVDVDGTRVMIVIRWSGVAEEDEQLQQMFDSMTLSAK